MAITVNCEEPTFPTRPGLGAAGTPCVVKTNRFFVGLLDEGMHHYDVSISPEPATKGLYREVMSRLVSEHQQGELGGRLLAHDDGDGCGASLFAAGALPFDTKEFEVTASPGDGKYKVVIRHAAAISLLQLRLLLAGYPTDVPVQALQVLDMVLRDVAFSERNDMGCVAVDRPFSSQNLGAMKDSGLGIEGWKGLYPSISLVQNGLSVTIGQMPLFF